MATYMASSHLPLAEDVFPDPPQMPFGVRAAQGGQLPRAEDVFPDPPKMPQAGQLPRAEDLIPDSWETSQPSSLPRAEDLIPDQPRPWGEVAASAFKNIPASAINAGHGVWQAVTSPVQTLGGIGDVLIGGLVKGANALGIDRLPGMSDEEKQRSLTAANALAQFYGDRYGSVEGVKNALATDPVGVGLDAFGVASMGGGALGKLGAVANMPKVAAAGEAMTNLGRFGDPMFYAGKAASAMDVPEKLYASALKPSATMTVDSRSKMIQAALDEGIPVSRKGLDGANKIISQSGDAVTQLVNDAAARGVGVSVNDSAAPVRNVLAQAVANPSDLNGARNVLAEFMDTYNPLHQAGYDTFIPVNTANEIKRNLWDEVGNKMGKIDATSGYTADAKKALGRGLRQQVETAVPDVVPLNQRMSPLMDLRPQLERALNRSENWNLIGLGALGGGIAGIGLDAMGAAGHGSLLGFPAGALAMKAIESPLSKSQVGIALNQMGKGNYFTSNIPNWLASAFLANRIANGDQ